MTERIVGWPMYAVDPAAVEAFWRVLRAEMRAAGLASAPAELARPDDLHGHWMSPDLLLSQTCGYPFVTSLAGSVRYVATPRFRALGCAGSLYSSAIVLRCDDSASGLADCAGKRVAFNSRDSQSGYNSLRGLVAPLAQAGRFFAEAIETGSHRRSLEAVAEGTADVAAIDAVTLALIRQAQPETVAALKVLAFTHKAPGLPLITARQTSEAEVALLRQALTIACTGPSAAALLMTGIDVLSVSAYGVIHDLRNGALACGYPELA